MHSNFELPDGWYLPDDADDEDGPIMWAEFLRELPSDHPLSDIAVELVAVRPASDDILLAQLGERDRLFSVHLSMSGRTERPDHPRVEFSGSRAQFFRREQALPG